MPEVSLDPNPQTNPNAFVTWPGIFFYFFLLFLIYNPQTNPNAFVTWQGIFFFLLFFCTCHDSGSSSSTEVTVFPSSYHYMCPHTTICVSSYYCIYVLVLLYACADSRFTTLLLYYRSRWLIYYRSRSSRAGPRRHARLVFFFHTSFIIIKQI